MSGLLLCPGTHSKALLTIRPDSERELAQDRQAEYALIP